LDELERWLTPLGLAALAPNLRANDVDLDILPALTEADLEKLGLSLGHRRKLLRAAATLSGVSSPPPSAAPSAERPRDPDHASAERRQVTIMFCDLVGSTALSARLDPEDMREIIGAYHRCCAERITEAGGFVAKYMGDGVLAYFGYPQAHEDDAERSVRSALALVEAVAKLQTSRGASLQVRVGIATGLVVVGDLVGQGDSQERGVVGETPNLAARLQSQAEPGQVVIANSTRRLAGGMFECRDLGQVALKGFGDAIQAWHVLGATAAESRFYAREVGELTPLVGRDEELDLLQRRWRQAHAGKGRVVLVSGEPGIGKSRLTDAFQGALSAEDHHRVRNFCSPNHASSAFYPVISQLGRAAGFERTDAPAQKLEKLIAVLNRTSGQAEEDIALIAELLSLPTTDRYRLPEMSAQKRKEKTLAALLSQLEALACQRPVLLLYEDVHWIDPSTHQLLDMAVERIVRLPVMLVITYRPEFEPPWTGQAHVTSLTLGRLGQGEGTSLVAGVMGDKELSAEIIAEIVERADGIPLFVEELTKAVLESGGSAEDAKRIVSNAPAPKLAVPATLHASLMARLDRLGPDAKEIAQIGAAIGREFTYELLAQIAQKSEAELRPILDRFSEAGLMYRRGVPPEATFLFKHALVRDAAYGTLLRSQRQLLHARIVSVLEGAFPELVKTQPETLAHHCAEAGSVSQAVEYYLVAAKRATRSFNNTEAGRHLEAATALVETLPASDPATYRLRSRLAMGGWWWRG
jgi:class 3 adenylate cyclase/ABC-type transport system involved in cytochrome c biogenesis ATPase subunit